MDGVVVRHGEVFGGVCRVEGPEVDDLAAVGVCYFYCLALLEEEGGAGAGGEGVGVGGGHFGIHGLGDCGGGIGDFKGKGERKEWVYR